MQFRNCSRVFGKTHSKIIIGQLVFSMDDSEAIHFAIRINSRQKPVDNKVDKILK